MNGYDLFVITRFSDEKLSIYRADITSNPDKLLEDINEYNWNSCEVYYKKRILNSVIQGFIDEILKHFKDNEWRNGWIRSNDEWMEENVKKILNFSVCSVHPMIEQSCLIGPEVVESEESRKLCNEFITITDPTIGCIASLVIKGAQAYFSHQKEEDIC